MAKFVAEGGNTVRVPLATDFQSTDLFIGWESAAKSPGIAKPAFR
jgi:hypothetical protein